MESIEWVHAFHFDLLFDTNKKTYISMPKWIPFVDLDKIKFYNSIDSVKVIQKAQGAMQHIEIIDRL